MAETSGTGIGGAAMKALSDWRDEIDRLDRELVALLNRRAESVLGLAPLKRRRGMPVHEPGREQRVVDNIVSSNRGPLSDEALERIYQAVIEEMRAVQRERVD